jgi:pimeloyl-ACP methyl ester carboxylesterase
MPYVEATGAKLYFEESGDGYPIIFIHELASDLRGWKAQTRYFSRSYRCIAYNARGYPPSDIPEDLTSYGWEFAVDDVASVMRGLAIERAHVVGLSTGGYAALQFGLRYPEKASAIVAANVGSGSHPSQRDAWLRETSVLARVFIDHGMVGMAARMARGPARIQLKYKDRTSWREFVVRLRQHSAQGMSNTMARCQALRPSLHDLRDQLSGMVVPVLLAVGDEDVRCLETRSSQCGSVDLPQHRPRHQSGRAVRLQCPDRKPPGRRRTRQLASRIFGNRDCSWLRIVSTRVSRQFVRPSRSRNS